MTMSHPLRAGPLAHGMVAQIAFVRPALTYVN
jgi:hypothetical protein